ncbi:MAG: hypothetical protein HOV78_05160 [Hamadaea sp.]|nr:hypothetical protein [Hamadaea sp.]
MSDEKREIPQSDEYGTPNAQAYDEHGNVRPADGRWLGDRNDDLSAAERVEMREGEIADADAELQERMAEANNPPAEPTGPDDGPEPAAEPEAQPEPDPGPQEPLVANPSLPEDPYAETSYADLQQAAKARNLNAGGTADEIRARLNAADADANSGITPTEQ